MIKSESSRSIDPGIASFKCSIASAAVPTANTR